MPSVFRYKFETDDPVLSKKTFYGSEIMFQLDENIVLGRKLFAIRYINHIFSEEGFYQHTNVGLDR